MCTMSVNCGCFKKYFLIMEMEIVMFNNSGIQKLICGSIKTVIMRLLVVMLIIMFLVNKAYSMESSVVKASDTEYDTFLFLAPLKKGMLNCSRSY